MRKPCGRATAPTITWNENFTSTPANVVVNNGVSTSTVLGQCLQHVVQCPGTRDEYCGNQYSIQFRYGERIASERIRRWIARTSSAFPIPTRGDFPTGVIAFTLMTTTPQGFVPGSNCPTYTTPCPIGNCIVDVDIMFNPAQTFATASPASSQFDLQSVATHEFGHLLGLDHSNIAHAVMYPYGDTSMIGIHTALEHG